MAKNFILIGAAGYIAPRHLQAIKTTGNNLLAVLDPHDSVGVLDKFFPEVQYYREFERFDRGVMKLIRGGTKVDYLAVCSPNFLHDAHIRFGLRIGANVICEKPLVINPWNCDALQEMEQETGGKVNAILQTRLHPAIRVLKVEYPKTDDHHVKLSYFAARGPWYAYSWKGNEEASGGLMMNIGIHFFDILRWIFGGVKGGHVNERVSDCSYVAGRLDLQHACVDWELSTQGRSRRVLEVDGEEIEFSTGPSFADLHVSAYREILAGRGLGIEDARPAIQLVHDLRESRWTEK